MKTIKAKGAIISCLSNAIIPEVILIFSIVVGKKRGMTGLVIYAIVVTILLNLFVLLLTIAAYRQYSIIYGNGNVVIEHGLVTGQFRIKKDEFLLEEIESYSVIYYHNKARADATVAYFQLKDRERTGYAFGFYTRKQINDFFQYIYEETGIEVQVSDPE